MREDHVYYLKIYSEELVINEYIIQEATLAADHLPEGFHQDRIIQTICSGSFKPYAMVQVNRLPMNLTFRLRNIYIGDLCEDSQKGPFSKSVQTIITFI